MKRYFRALLPLFLALTLPASADDSSGWTVLFDGSSTDHWRGFKTDEFPDGGWKVEEGLLISIGDGRRIDLITRERYTNFEFEVEWRVEPHGNSGIFYRVSEESDAIWHAAPEYQILDDRRVSNSIQSTGALYDLVPPNDRKKLNPPGEFNRGRVVVRGNQVEHWLNGEKIAVFDFDDPALQEKIAESKFGEFESFAKVETGHIGLQHHGDTVAFRNIRVRELPATVSD